MTEEQKESIKQYLIVDTRCNNIAEESFDTSEEALADIEDTVSTESLRYFKVVKVKVLKTFKLRVPSTCELVEE